MYVWGKKKMKDETEKKKKLWMIVIFQVFAQFITLDKFTFSPLFFLSQHITPSLTSE